MINLITKEVTTVFKTVYLNLFHNELLKAKMFII